MKAKERFLKKLKDGYLSSPIEFTSEELEVVEKNGYVCDGCLESVFEMDDYPFIREGRCLCEDCWEEEYTERCPVCEELYEKDEQEGKDEYFFITPGFAKETSKEVGMYKVLEKPFFYGDIVCGFDGFYSDAIEKVNDLDIEAYLQKEYNNPDLHVPVDIMCPECAKKYLEIGNKQEGREGYG